MVDPTKIPGFSEQHNEEDFIVVGVSTQAMELAERILFVLN